MCAPCEYARVGMYKCFRATAGIVHWKRRGEGGVTSRRVGFEENGSRGRKQAAGKRNPTSTEAVEAVVQGLKSDYLTFRQK